LGSPISKETCFGVGFLGLFILDGLLLFIAGVLTGVDALLISLLPRCNFLGEVEGAAFFLFTVSVDERENPLLSKSLFNSISFFGDFRALENEVFDSSNSTLYIFCCMSFFFFLMSGDLLLEFICVELT